MQATPVTKRAGAGSSPTKRASRRVAAEPSSTEVVPTLDQPQLLVEVHKLFRQSQKDQETFDGITDALNQHASRIDGTKSDVDLLTNDVKLVAGDVLRNDVQLKENLKKLEELVTAQGAGDKDLRDKLRMLEEVVTGHGVAIRDGAGVSSSGEAATAEVHTGHLTALENKVKQEIGRIEAMIRDIQAEKIYTRLAEMQSSMAAMGDGIQRRFETLEAKQRPWPNMEPQQTSGPAIEPTMPQQPRPAFPATQVFGTQQQPQPQVFGTQQRPQPQVFQQPLQPQQQQQQPQQYYCGDRDRESHRSLFDDKVAVADVMRYPLPTQTGQEVAIDKKMAWSKSTRNYFISKAQEMERILKWAESFQTTTIVSQHVEDLINQGLCMDNSPGKLSRDLWGFLNLNISGTSKDRSLFDGAVGGNGLDAWRRLLEPLGPNTEERLYTMHDRVTHPKASKTVKDVIQDLNIWEDELAEYYRCGGEPVSIFLSVRLLPVSFFLSMLILHVPALLLLVFVLLLLVSILLFLLLLLPAACC